MFSVLHARYTSNQTYLVLHQTKVENMFFAMCVTLGWAGSWIYYDTNHTWCFRMPYDVVTAHMWSRCFCRVCDSRQSRFLNILWHRPHIMSSRGACTVRICRNNPPRCPEYKQKNLCLFLIAVFCGRCGSYFDEKMPHVHMHQKTPTARRPADIFLFFISSCSLADPSFL